ncbi:unnamed protein product [Xylocopa violacea]|uniref:Uncharacterized protein n=1 Tax=Xylocopa violacea TaxID=135666 RepID=A0ABP1NYR2_XYLVO
MVKFKWHLDKIQTQRTILLGVIGIISIGILRGHRNYERKVSEYMSSLEYRRAREASHDYSVKRMKENQRRLLSGEPPSSGAT